MIIRELAEYGVQIQVHDPLAGSKEAKAEYGVELVPFEQLAPAAAVIIAVPHKEYCEMAAEKLLALTDCKPVLIDVKGILDGEAFKELGARVWRL